MEGKESVEPRKPAKFLGRHIMVKGRYVEAILKGEKKATIRKGIVRLRHDELIVHGAGRPVAKIRVKNIVYKRVRELTDEDARLDGFSSKEELIRELEKAYGSLSSDDYVTIIEFDVIQDLTHLEPSDPYMGLSPADIARLALRYLSDLLSNEEKKVLVELTKTNSIRLTAIRLYGSLSKRWMVRKVLKKSLRKLVEKGYITTGSNKRAA